MLSYVLPTRNRPERLRRTLAALGELDAREHERIGGGEVIVIDNASDSPLPPVPAALANRLPLRAVRLNENRGAAARNVGVELARGDAGGWIVMLDDDSHPLDSHHIDVLLDARADVAAIGAEIVLPDGSRERGGLPEVFIGCGVAIRRDAFLQVGGYDATFDYYAEEYDLCAKLLLAGWRITHDMRVGLGGGVGGARGRGRFRVLHEKIAAGRDFNAIIHRLVRNNAWVMQRYAPEEARAAEIAHIIERYAAIAMKENAARGFAAGMYDLANTLANQPRSPMPPHLWERFTGAAHVREALFENQIPTKLVLSGASVAIIDLGKNSNLIEQVVRESGAMLTDDADAADILMIGSLSPGPMLDAFERHRHDPRVRTPWHVPAATGAILEPAGSSRPAGSGAW